MSLAERAVVDVMNACREAWREETASDISCDSSFQTCLLEWPVVFTSSVRTVPSGYSAVIRILQK